MVSLLPNRINILTYSIWEPFAVTNTVVCFSCCPVIGQDLHFTSFRKIWVVHRSLYIRNKILHTNVLQNSEKHDSCLSRYLSVIWHVGCFGTPQSKTAVYCKQKIEKLRLSISYVISNLSVLVCFGCFFFQIFIKSTSNMHSKREFQSVHVSHFTFHT